MTVINKLLLENFRKFPLLELEPKGKNVVITGPNGAGKTNILEAISLVAAGNGLRSAEGSDLDNLAAQERQLLGAFKLNYKEGNNPEQELIFQRVREEKGVRINKHISVDGNKVSQIDLIKYFNVIWLSPSMEYAVLQDSSARRKFLDRITFNFFPEHAKMLTQYQNLLQERIRALTTNYHDKILLNILEQKISDIAASIFLARLATVNQLNKTLSLETGGAKVRLSLEGKIEEITAGVELTNKNIADLIKLELEKMRTQDRDSNRTTHGIHRTRLKFYNLVKDIDSDLCSSGEQKFILISVLLASVRSVIELQNRTPIVLLDDISAHLDQTKQAYLLSELNQTKAQIWISNITKSNIPEHLDDCFFVELE